MVSYLLHHDQPINIFSFLIISISVMGNIDLHIFILFFFFFLYVNFHFFYRQHIHHTTCTEQDKHIISVNDSYCYLCAQHITTFFSEINCNCNYHPNPPKPLYIYNDQNDKIVTNSLYILFLLRV
jgi:hypothetical protein